MKIRNGFVSNSSSSSFTCDVCGEDVSGWDLCLSEAEMVECENGHTFCESHTIDGKDIMSVEIQKKYVIDYCNKIINDPKHYLYDWKEDYVEVIKGIESGETEDDDIPEIADEYEYRYHVPAEFCPICQFEKLMASDVKVYMYKKYGIDDDALKAEIKEKYSSYKEFKDSLE